jgi:hypothetical protein
MIDKKYGIPVDEITCPGCGKKYGHHNTKVDVISQECSKCVALWKYDKVELVSATYFIEEVLQFKPYMF